jgi:predicted RNA-binding protein with PIN domain
MRALVIDGYNVIFRTSYLCAIADKDLMQARNDVTKIARQYQKKIGGIDKLKVVFDGQDKYRDRNTCPYQKYSGTGQGDTEIIRTIEQFAIKYNVSVVSNDNFVKNNARAHSASVIKVEQFLNTVGNNEGAKNFSPLQKTEKPDKKISTKQANKINKDLMKEWGL